MARVASRDRFRAELDEALAGVGQEQDPVETIGGLGARLILQQALLLGALGYAIAYGLGLWVFPRFPRRVVIVQENLVLLAGVVLAVSVLASLLGVYKALRVQPNEVLS